jgi:membrane peptidoglycan carboxypeptidase
MSSLVVRRRLRARRNGNGFGKGNGHGGGGFLRWVLIAVLALGFLGAVGVAIGVGSVYAVYQHYARDYVPIEEKLRQSHIGLTEIYDRGGPDGGEFLGALPNPDAQLLEPVPLGQISEWMIMATVSTEDNSFWSHSGVNLRGLLRAGYERYVLGDVETGTGGSSITMQLIKNIYICPQFGDVDEACEVAERTVDRKLREIAYAIELEQDYSKEEILGWYLNQISYASRYVGVQAAAQGYFRKDATELELHEAALLAGIPSHPSLYHPRNNCVVEEGTEATCVVDGLGRTLVGGAAKARQEDVLDLMVTHGWITTAQAEAAKAESLRVYPQSNPIKAAAFIDNQVQPRLVRMCEAGILEMLPGAVDCRSSVHSAGYQVTTTLDWQATQEALEFMRERNQIGLDRGCNCYNASLVTIEPSTGEIIVYVPNLDPDNTTDPRIAGAIDQAVEIRQPGSAFKPLIYLAWFDALNKAPMSTFWDTNNLPADGAVIRNPRSDRLGSEGLITARQGLGGSQNIPAFRAAYEAGLDNVIAYAKRVGMTTLDQNFDPTFLSHADVSYGASIATGGANIRVVDMAYMNAVFANMGEMVGVPHLARTVPLDQLGNLAFDTGSAYERAWQQAIEFQRGNIRIPGTRELDPVVVLEVRDASGNVVFRQGEPERRQVVDPGSVWLLHSIMADCTARLIIWGCGGSNLGDTALDFFADGVRVPAGVKTGTQQGPLSAADTLSTWTAGYSRYAATALWVGNSNNDLVRDGPAAGYAAAHTTIHTYKGWMGRYHEYLQERGVVGDTFIGFDDLRPGNVAQVGFPSPATDRGHTGGCDQTLSGWVRTDIQYQSECEEVEIDTRNGLLAGPDTPSQYRETRKFVILPTLGTDLARQLAQEINKTGKKIPVKPQETSTGAPAVSITAPTNASTVNQDTDVVGNIGSADVTAWRLELGRGGSPSEWIELGAGDARVSNSVLGRIVLTDLEEEGVYTLRLVAEDALLGDLQTSIQINITLIDPDPDEPTSPGQPGQPGQPGGGGQPGQPGGGGQPGPNDPTQHPLGYELCGFDPDCGGRPAIVVRCGPLGWFVDPEQEWSIFGWQRFVVQDPADAASRAAQVCTN